MNTLSVFLQVCLEAERFRIAVGCLAVKLLSVHHCKVFAGCGQHSLANGIEGSGGLTRTTFCF
jgi:hypothetical protein